MAQLNGYNVYRKDTQMWICHVRAANYAAAEIELKRRLNSQDISNYQLKMTG